MKIDKSEFRVRPRFLLFLFVVFILCPWIASILLPANNGKKKAQIYFTHFETKEIATALNQHSVKIGGLTNIDNNFVIQAVFGTDGTINVNYHPTRTNSQGQVLDCWETPYQIEILSRTNFVVRSAGPNKKFGDADDIIFNSVSNGFVKP
jgi:hypothetical protein